MTTRTFHARAAAEKARFMRALEDPHGEQERLFRRYVADNAATAFGREHDFSALKTIADYRRAVPVRDYQTLSPWIERVVAGERGVLTIAPPVVFFSTTGTTGKPKMLTVTREFLTRWARNLLIFWANVGDIYPEALERDDTLLMLSLAPKPFARWTSSGVPILVPTEMPATLGDGGFPFTRSPWFPPPVSLSDAERVYYLARRSLESQIVGIVCLHSSRLQALAGLMEREAPRLIEEIGNGTVLGKKVSMENRARARELEMLRKSGPLVPSRVWPSLKFISCWVGASFDLYRADIERDFSPHIFPQMVGSSDLGFMTTSLDSASGDGLLTIDSNLYEFLPVDTANDETPTLSFDELETGRTYEMIATTCTGLYRYRCGDRFEVTGFARNVPRLLFVGRSGTSDLTGEKLTEQHVDAAFKEELSVRNLAPLGATLCAVWGRPSHYLAFIEPSSPLSKEAESDLERGIDSALQRQSERYSMKRAVGDLGPVVLRIVPPGTFAAYRAQRVLEGVASTQLKDKILHFPSDKAGVAALEAVATAISYQSASSMPR